MPNKEFNGLIPQPELLGFSQDFKIVRPSIKVDPLFPDRKTQNLLAEYQIIASNGLLPTMALVHAMDTEAEIGSRPAIDTVMLEKMLIKRKINTTERMEMLKKHAGVPDTALKRYVFDDASRLMESVNLRTKVMKAELLTTGKLTIRENNLDFEVDYRVPAENLAFTADFSTDDADPAALFNEVNTYAGSLGLTINGIMTSSKIMNRIRSLKSMQTIILGNVGVGALVPKDRLEAYLSGEFGYTRVIINDDQYGVDASENGVQKVKRYRYTPENHISFFVANASGAVGEGLWGVTVEEEKSGAFTEKSMRQFITIAQWETPDPPATWTKAAGLFVPVLPNPSSLFGATITLPGDSASAASLPAKKSARVKAGMDELDV